MAEARKPAGRPRAPRTAAGNTAAKAVDAAANGTAKGVDVVEEVAEKAAHINTGAVSAGFGNVGVGFIALAVCVYSGALSYTKFKAALQAARAVAE
jgi:hypothetical protein